MTTRADISVRRVGDVQDEAGRARLLVDRVWPRGVARSTLELDAWLRDIAPSDGLRKWFGHDPELWEEFRHRYSDELDANPVAVARAIAWCRRGPVTLLFSARDRDHNQAVVLKEYLQKRLAQEEAGWAMNDENCKAGGTSSYASPPCFAHEIAPDYFDPFAVDPVQAKDVARWRRSERARLLAARQRMSVAERGVVNRAINHHVAGFLRERFADLAGCTLSGFWPIKGEPDLRQLLSDWHAAGASTALPVVEIRHAPLVFRRWTPQTRMVRGDWNIPVPATGAEAVRPEVTLAPLVGWDDACFRLGYGGGYFDRTLAALTPRPFVIGIGFQAARLATIYPQPHDIRLDAVVTEAGLQVLKEPE